MISISINACDKLKQDGINVRLIHMTTIKPIDREIIKKASRETKFILTCEEHFVIGGLDQMVSSITSETIPTKVIKLGINNTFEEFAKQNELLEKYGLTCENIVNIIKNLYIFFL